MFKVMHKVCEVATVLLWKWKEGFSFSRECEEPASIMYDLIEASASLFIPYWAFYVSTASLSRIIAGVFTVVGAVIALMSYVRATANLVSAVGYYLADVCGELND